MMGKHGRVRRDLYEDRGGDLSDVNELELEKESSVEAEEISEMEEEEDKVDKKEEADEESEMAECEETSDDAGLPAVAAVSEDTDIVSVSEATEEQKEESHEEEAQEQSGGGEEEDIHSEPRSEKKRRKGGGLYVAVILLCLLASMAILAFVVMDREREPNETDSEPADTDGTVVTESDRSDAVSADMIYSVGVRSAVTVIAQTEGELRYGSGVAVFSDGYVATLYDTVKGSQGVDVVLWDGSAYAATVVGAEEVVNLALLKIDATLECVTVGDSSALRAGDRIYAIGTVESEKLASSLFSGEVSYAARLLELTDASGAELRIEAMQITALPCDELCGCPIFNGSGETVGMALITGNGAVSFALPMDRAVKVLEAMRDGDEPSAEVLSALAYTLPRLGIMGEQRGVDGTYGVAIMGFSQEDSDAARKLRVDDLIIAIGDIPVTDTAGLRSAVEAYKSGEKVEVFVMRKGQKLSFYVELG